jgi:exodeoxyribonuclease VII small subunit
MTEPRDNVDFEAALAELEQLVERMEAGDLTLEQSLQAFERGIALTRDCQQALKAAELRVQALTESDTGAILTDLDSRDIDAADDD